MATERNTRVNALLEERTRFKRLTPREREVLRGQLGALNSAQIPQKDWPSDDHSDAFESIVSDIGDDDSEVAVEVLLRLIRREIDALEATTRDEPEAFMRSNTRIERLLDDAVHHQASMDGWLNRRR